MSIQRWFTICHLTKYSAKLAQANTFLPLNLLGDVYVAVMLLLASCQKFDGDNDRKRTNNNITNRCLQVMHNDA